MSQYLYGASVQGIQDFIFQTNKLREIVGASELVESICTDFFKGQVDDFNEANLVLGAAGNIKYIFDSEQSCQKLVLKFPKAVMEMAPGITISQAVVKLDGSGGETQMLEDRLKIQRNKAISITSGIGFMVTKTARRTGNPGVDYKKDEVIDWAQEKKLNIANTGNKKLLEKISGNKSSIHNSFPYDVADMLDGEENNSWIAVIHADGNNLGQLIMKMVEISAGNIQSVIKNFSKIVNEINIEAAAEAFKIVVKVNKKGVIPFRPVILGGDDLTAIIRGDLALQFIKVYLEKFESISKMKMLNFANDNKLKEDIFKHGLTSCAGIAYIKASYPFHYAIRLAESLCKEAKKTSKNIVYAKKNSKNIYEDLTPSSLMFHKVHASFVEEYEDIIDQELTAMNNIQFNYGPYFTQKQDGFATIVELTDWVKSINRKDAPKAGLRNWLTQLQNNPENANQWLERVKTLHKRYIDKLNLAQPFVIRDRQKGNENISIQITPLFDIITLSTIQKNNENE